MISFSFIDIFAMLPSEFFLEKSPNKTKTFQLVKEHVNVEEPKYAKNITMILIPREDTMNVFIPFAHLLHLVHIMSNSIACIDLVLIQLETYPSILQTLSLELFDCDFTTLSKLIGQRSSFQNAT